MKLSIIYCLSLLPNITNGFGMVSLPAELQMIENHHHFNKIKHQEDLLKLHLNQENQITKGIQNFILPPANAANDLSNSVSKSASSMTTPSLSSPPPTEIEIKLLREALGAFYGERNMEKAQELLTKAINAWERQPPDELAALYRVRGDVYMELLNPKDAVQDYSQAIDLLTLPEAKDLADPGEMPAARLGRARSMQSIKRMSGSVKDASGSSKQEYDQMVKDYQIALRLTSREDWDTEEEKEQDGASRNPYAAWEYGMALRGAGDYKKAAEVHTLAALSFKDIGDRARSVISALDAGIDMAATNDVKEAKTMLENAISTTTSVEGRDVELLQRVIAKEGEARVALASVLWSANEKSAAEAQLGEACSRLDQLQADADAREAARIKSGAMPPTKYKKLPFTIDDIVGTECSCSRFKNDKFRSDSLFWPESLQAKVMKLNNLSK
jgi:tetratricopeptide (TPR) repeat protein